VKIQARDVLATWKVLVSLAVVPVLYISYGTLATYFTYHYDLSLGYQRYIFPILVFFVLPSLGYAALKFGEAGMDVMKWVTTGSGSGLD
jgi:glycerol-3-phosphate O-acyltransferase/dihydroxyacetone phosphate acyltransferase